MFSSMTSSSRNVCSLGRRRTRNLKRWLGSIASLIRDKRVRGSKSMLKGRCCLQVVREGRRPASLVCSRRWSSAHTPFVYAAFVVFSVIRFQVKVFQHFSLLLLLLLLLLISVILQCSKRKCDNSGDNQNSEFFFSLYESFRTTRT